MGHGFVLSLGTLVLAVRKLQSEADMAASELQEVGGFLGVLIGEPFVCSSYIKEQFIPF